MIVVVTIVILLVSLAAYGFLMLMETENMAALARGDQLQAEAVAASGREYLAAVLELPRAERPAGGESEDVADDFGGVVVDAAEDEHDESVPEGRFSIVTPQLSETGARNWRFGYVNESAKLNLARLLASERRRPGSARDALMNLPNMDESTADAILDWIDPDDAPRDLGAESDYYAGLNPPIRPRNGIPPSLEELLLVRGVTREKLFGLDVNANFRVDAWEEDLAQSQSPSVGGAELPWSYFLTVRSGERDETYDGEPRIQLNQSDLGRLHLQLGAALPPSWSNFLVAYRQYGPSSAGGEAEDASELVVDLSQPPQRPIFSPLELIGVRVAIPEGSEGKRRVFLSPFTDDPAQMRQYLPQLMDQVTTGNGAPIFGRVNINLAPREVLMGLPGIDAALADRIISARSLLGSDDPSHRHAVWLLTEGIVDRRTMRRLERYVTVGGDVGRAQILGYYDLRAPITRFETVVDGTERPARQVYYKDLRRLGRGPLEDVMNVANTP